MVFHDATHLIYYNPIRTLFPLTWWRLVIRFGKQTSTSGWGTGGEVNMKLFELKVLQLVSQKLLMRCPGVSWHKGQVSYKHWGGRLKKTCFHNEGWIRMISSQIFLNQTSKDWQLIPSYPKLRWQQSPTSIEGKHPWNLWHPTYISLQYILVPNLKASSTSIHDATSISPVRKGRKPSWQSFIFTVECLFWHKLRFLMNSCKHTNPLDAFGKFSDTSKLCGWPYI